MISSIPGANKFLDTSYHIYNQQKVHRSKLAEPYDPKEFFDDNIDEHLPLRGNGNNASCPLLTIMTDRSH